MAEFIAYYDIQEYVEDLQSWLQAQLGRRRDWEVRERRDRPHNGCVTQQLRTPEISIPDDFLTGRLGNLTLAQLVVRTHAPVGKCPDLSIASTKTAIKELQRHGGDSGDMRAITTNTREVALGNTSTGAIITRRSIRHESEYSSGKDYPSVDADTTSHIQATYPNDPAEVQRLTAHTMPVVITQFMQQYGESVA